MDNFLKLEEVHLFIQTHEQRLLYTFVSILIVSTLYLLFGPNGELPAVKYTLPLLAEAQPDWKGTTLESPSIKEPGLSGIQCYCPATAQDLGQVNPVTTDGIDRAVSAASSAQIGWARTSFAERRHVLRSILQFVLDNQEAIARVAARDSGKPMTDASFGEILVTAEKLSWTIKHGEKALVPESRPTNFLMAYKRNEVRFEPLGVVAACISWNYPFHNFMGPVIAALFAGNAIVVKPSERTAWSAAYFLQVVRLALVACGHSGQLVQSVVMWPQVAPHLTSHPGISHITFIGSRPVSKHVLASAATSITPVCVELGGKDPCIVLNDVKDLKGTAAIVLRGSFQSAGQNCIGIERVIAQSGIYDRLIEELEAKVKRLRVGAGLDEENIDVGAMVSADGFDFLERVIEEAVTAGARLLVGGKRYKHPKYPKAHYFMPTLIVDVMPSMRISQEELFAPVCLVMKADSVSHAIELANSTTYSLGAAVFGTKQSDLQAVVNGVKSGMVSVNDFAVSYLVQLPFGGVGGSGYGRFAGEEGLRSLCNIKSVCQDRFPTLINTKIPAPHLYPIKNMDTAWEVAQGIVLLGYGGLIEKAKGLKSIITNV